MPRLSGWVGFYCLVFTIAAVQAQANVVSLSAFSRTVLHSHRYRVPLRAAATGVGLRSNIPVPEPPSHTKLGSPYGETLQVGNTKDPMGLVTFAHGLGDAGERWTSTVDEFAQRLPSLLFLLPSAPPRPETKLVKGSMPAWYGMFGSDDVDDIQESAAYMHSLTKFFSQRYRIRPTNVVYGGIGQGAVVSIFAALTDDVRPKGTYALSAYMTEGFDLLLTRAKNKDVPLLLCHGEQDPLTSVQESIELLEGLTQRIGYSRAAITMKSYPDAGYSTFPNGKDDLRDWLANLPWDAMRP